MTWTNIITQLQYMIREFLKVCNLTYNMIVNNTLLLVFVLVFALFVGLALLKRLIHT